MNGLVHLILPAHRAGAKVMGGVVQCGREVLLWKATTTAFAPRLLHYHNVAMLRADLAK